jgi:hypothetical protein
VPGCTTGPTNDRDKREPNQVAIDVAAPANSADGQHLLGAGVAQRADELPGARQLAVHVVGELGKAQIHKHTAWRPSAVTMVLPGLISRCTTPASCRAWAAPAA